MKKITFFLLQKFDTQLGANILFFFLIFALFLFAFPSFAGKQEEEILRAAHAPKEILVKFKNLPKINLIKIAENNDLYKIIAAYNARPDVEFAEPNYLYKTAIIPDDKEFAKQWYLQKIKAPEAWYFINKAPQKVIAIIDTGIQISHPDLVANIWTNNEEIPNNGKDDDHNGLIDDYYGWDFTSENPDPSPKFNSDYTVNGVMHGTLVAGVAAAAGNNEIGISGVSWQTKIMALKALNDRGQGSTANVIRAIDYAIDKGADIINLSFVGFGYSRSLEMAIERAYHAGIIIVAAAGNEEDTSEDYFLDKRPMYPVCFDGKYGENMVIGVAATDSLDQKAAFSAYGSKCIDISAPGVSIFSTAVYAPKQKKDNYIFNKYYDGYWSGTSLSVPMVSAACALIGEANIDLSRESIVRLLKYNADSIVKLNPEYRGLLGTGRLNLKQSVYAAIINKNNAPGKLIYAASKGKEPKLFLADLDGKEDGLFFAYDPRFRGGVNVAAGDIDGDGKEEIITGAGFSGGPQVRVFDQKGKVITQFFAYDPRFRGGVNVAAGDIDQGIRDKKEEIITTPGKGELPLVKIFKYQKGLVNKFFAYNQNFRGGVKIYGADINNDGNIEIITGAGAGGGPHIRVFTSNGRLLGSFYGFEQDFTGGVNVAAIYK